MLTHGFVVDEHKRKISKSLGNYIAADVMVERYGADVLPAVRRQHGLRR